MSSSYVSYLQWNYKNVKAENTEVPPLLNAGALAKTVEEIHRTLADGVSLLIYPEGTTTDGESGMLPFKATSFATVIGTGFKIQPIITQYLRDQDNWNPAWYGDQTLLPHLWKFLGRKKTHVVVTALEPVTPLPGEDRKALAARVEKLMTEAMAKKIQ